MATNLTRASQELFRRTPDECFATFADLRQHCEAQRNASQDRWHLPQDLVLSSEMTLRAGHDGAELRLNDWSFSQLCRMAGVAKDTINRLTHKTASRALQETLPRSEKPMQLRFGVPDEDPQHRLAPLATLIEISMDGLWRYFYRQQVAEVSDGCGS